MSLLVGYKLEISPHLCCRTVIAIVTLDLIAEDHHQLSMKDLHKWQMKKEKNSEHVKKEELKDSVREEDHLYKIHVLARLLKQMKIMCAQRIEEEVVIEMEVIVSIIKDHQWYRIQDLLQQLQKWRLKEKRK